MRIVDVRCGIWVEEGHRAQGARQDDRGQETEGRGQKRTRNQALDTTHQTEDIRISCGSGFQPRLEQLLRL